MRVNEILNETSLKIGRCAHEMTRKGSCPGKCNFPHKPPNNKQDQPVQERRGRVCFRELIEKGSCRWGDSKCRFSHKITEDQRNDQVFLQNNLREKDEKASKCFNEFREKGLCKNGDKCPFSHKITEDERKNDDLKMKMEEKGGVMNKRKELTEESKEAYDPARCVKEMMNLRKEFAEMKEIMMKVQRRP